MTFLQAFRRFGWVSGIIVAVTLVAVVLLERGGESTFTASGTIMVARSEVDPSRTASRAVNLTSAIADTSTVQERESFAEDGGRDDFRIIQVSENRAQVLASGDGAVPGVRAVLRSLADNVAGQQLAAEIDPGERVRPRLFLQIPGSDLEALGVLEGSSSGELPEVVGTLVLEDPLAGMEDPLGGAAAAARLVLLHIHSDDGTQAVLDALPPGADFSVSVSDQEARELLAVNTSGRSPTDALESFDTVTSAVETELDRRQELAEVPSDARLLVDVIAAPVDAVEADEGLAGRTLTLLLLGFGVAVTALKLLSELWPERNSDRHSRRVVEDSSKTPKAPDASESSAERVSDDTQSPQGTERHPVL